MIKNRKVSEVLLYVSLLLFVVFGISILCINSDVLYTAHNRSEFLIGSPYFDTLMSKPFGLIRYVGAWLTQFLYIPVLGIGLYLAIWGCIFFVGLKAFRLSGSAVALMLLPVACLLTSIVDLGYWIYDSTIKGYWFSQSVGYLIMLLLLWVARCTPRQWHILWYLVGFGLYPILGWFSLLFVVCLVVTDKPSWRELIGIVLLFVAANIWRSLLYNNIKQDDVVLAGLPRFVTPSDVTDSLSVPFWVLGAASILISMFGRFLAKWFVPVLCTVASIVFTLSFMYQDKNYTNEMRMVHYAEEDNWHEVLNTFTESKKPTISMVMLKNVALMHEGGLLDRSFKMGNDATTIYNPDSVHVSFLEIASSVVYYNYGMMNEGFRLSFECGEQAGFSPYYLKMLCRCALANGEKELVDRFLKLIHGHPFYSNWQPKPIDRKINELQEAYLDELTGVENSDSYIVNSVSLWNQSDSKVASEQALFYSMMRCDSRRFWKSLRNYVKLHLDEEFPLHAQEAYIMIMDKHPEEKRMMLPVSQEVYDRYKKFWSTLENLVRSGENQREIPEKMRAEFGDTYWYFNIFGRKIY